jgi:crotonobetaine/carnitine-CoA ligase
MANEDLLQGAGLAPGPYQERYPLEERSLVRVLADQAARRGDKDWLVFDAVDRLTVASAWQGACAVGHALDERFPPQAHVAVMLRNQPEFVVAFFGGIVRGGVSVPLNPDARGPLLYAVLEDSDAEVLVVRADLLAVLEELEGLAGVRLVVVVGEGALPETLHGADVVGWDGWLRGRQETHVWPLPTYDQPAMIQFTSGTTARAKGSLYSHHFLYLYSAMVSDSQHRREDDILTTPLPLCHAAALHIITTSALHAGCTAHLKSRFSASRFWEEVAEDGATWSILLGPVAAMVLRGAPETIPEHRMERMFIVPYPDELSDFEKRFRVAVCWQGYGMTEVYPFPVPAVNRPGLPRSAAGVPVTWMKYGVVDEEDRMVAPGEIGELVFAPDLPHAMIDGYYKDPERTAEAFRNGRFHTGDLGYYQPDGTLHFVGRKHERIRRRGENITAPELEWLAVRHPQVVAAAAYGVPSELGEDDVKLDVQVMGELTPPELHEWFTKNAPKHMVPRYLEFREDFPRTPSQRIEKYKLQQLPLDRPEVYDAEAEPAGRVTSG